MEKNGLWAEEGTGDFGPVEKRLVVDKKACWDVAVRRFNGVQPAESWCVSSASAMVPFVLICLRRPPETNVFSWRTCSPKQVLDIPTKVPLP